MFYPDETRRAKDRKAEKRNGNNSIQNGTSHVTDIEGVFNG